jgi:hypothetical protein
MTNKSIADKSRLRMAGRILPLLRQTRKIIESQNPPDFDAKRERQMELLYVNAVRKDWDRTKTVEAARCGMTSVLKNTTQAESAKLELLGAEHRLEVALRGLREFQKLFGTVDGKGVFTFRLGIEADLLDSLQRELRQLHVELDEAGRALVHARGQIVGER